MDISKIRCAGCGREMMPTRLTCDSCNLVLDGEFEIPALARLPLEDQVFIVAFVRHHGSIKKMESLFGISYPTVKNRLNAIGAELNRSFQVPSPHLAILEQLEQGRLTVDEALERIR